MNIQQFREAQATFANSIDTVKEGRAPLHTLREQFVRFFTSARIAQMEIEDYALGYPKPEAGFNFCYGLERQLDGLGRMLGSFSIKFGIYFSRTRQQLKMSKIWGSTAPEAFAHIKQALIALIEAGQVNDLISISNSRISPVFKGKILATYFPDRFLNVFSDDHLDYFLIQLNLDTPQLIAANPIYKKQALVDFKNNDTVMHDWSLDLYSYFLYNYYPGRPPKKQQDENDSLTGYQLPAFPANPRPIFVNLDMLPSESGQTNSNNRAGDENPDYEGEARKLKQLGDRGEKIVLDMERERLRAAGREVLANKVRRARFDYEGYDIYSYEENGSPKHIEVKATRAPVGKVNFFLTANELKKSEELDNYHVYVVFEILSHQPKIWDIGNPFHPENANVIKIPIAYKVTIHAE